MSFKIKNLSTRKSHQNPLRLDLKHLRCTIPFLQKKFMIPNYLEDSFVRFSTIMNGFRFGKAGWEIAFGPGFGLSKESRGFFDTEGIFGDKGAYLSQNDFNQSEYYIMNSDVSSYDPSYNFDTFHMDARGITKVSTSFLFAFGRTFRAGALNIPVNVFYSSKKGGGLAGMSVGFNVMKTKKDINPRRVL